MGGAGRRPLCSGQDVAGRWHCMEGLLPVAAVPAVMWRPAKLGLNVGQQPRSTAQASSTCPGRYPVAVFASMPCSQQQTNTPGPSTLAPPSLPSMHRKKSSLPPLPLVQACPTRAL